MNRPRRPEVRRKVEVNAAMEASPRWATQVTQPVWLGAALLKVAQAAQAAQAAKPALAVKAVS